MSKKYIPHSTLLHTTMPLPDIYFAHALNTSPKIGAKTLRLLKTHFGSFENAWQAPLAEYRALGISQEIVDSCADARTHITPERAQNELTRLAIWLMDESDAHYPPLLRESAQPPALLYGRGDRAALATASAIAIVGTRKPTRYGLEATRALVRDLAPSGITIVSGLATGIDGAAHEAALAEKAITVAVLGSGINENSLFPSHHIGLSRRIVATGGALISEFPPGTPGLKHHFPQRNRIVAGMTSGVIIIEARERSGALITARMAIDNNREVLVVPGSIFSPTSVGPNLLLREGAIPVQCGRDVLHALGMDYINRSEVPIQALDAESQRILLQLSEPLTVDELSLRMDIAIPLLASRLSMLELKGLVVSAGPGIYMRRNRPTD